MTAVVVSQESRDRKSRDEDENSSSGSETEVEEEGEERDNTLKNEVQKTEVQPSEIDNSTEVEREKPEVAEETVPIVGVNQNKTLELQGQRIKTVQKLSNNRPVGKFKEQAFKKKVYSRRLPQV